MTGIVTTKQRNYAAKQLLTKFQDTSQSFYVFIGRTLSWTDDMNPPVPASCESEESALYRDMMSLKRIGTTDVSLVIPRHNWTTGTVYSQYFHDVNFFDPNSVLAPVYVVNSSLGVYKCLSNNGGAASTVEPSGTSTLVSTLSDGYKWKYMYTVATPDITKFVTTDWVPVKTLLSNDGSSQWSVQTAAVAGTIDRIDLQTAGTLYGIIPTVTITGDGTGATATATISGGSVTGVQVTSVGSGYTWATITISGGGVGASGATAKAIISPIGGHGSNPEIELGATTVFINSKLTNSEGGAFTVANDFRRVGIVLNPLLTDGVTVATASTYSQAVSLTFSSVTGASFVGDEVVTCGSKSGVVVDYDSTAKVLRLVETVGTFATSDVVVGASANGTVSAVGGKPLKPFTGDVMYIENRSPIPRSSSQIEDIKIPFRF